MIPALVAVAFGFLAVAGAVALLTRAVQDGFDALADAIDRRETEHDAAQRYQAFAALRDRDGAA
jgi:hypothetical protein